MPLQNQSLKQENQLLKRERELRGWSQGDLARAINVPDYYISRWERGTVVPSSYYKQRLCKLFGKTAEELGFLQQPSTADVQIQSTSAEKNSQPPSPQKWRSVLSRPYLSFFLLAIIVLGAVASIGVFLIKQESSNAHSLIVGSVSFSNSGVLSTNSPQGIVDELHLQLHLDRLPSAGMVYYAWLMPDQNNPEGNVISLGPLVTRQLQAQLIYRGDALHTNLLLNHGSLLITEQIPSPIPQAPLLNQARYQSVIDQDKAPGTSYSLLDHFRHLLARDPDLESRGLRGGLVTWLGRNNQQVLAWVNDASNQRGHPKILHQDLLRMLAYLDGLENVSQDLPTETLLSTQLVNRNQGSIGLLNIVPEQPVPGYLLHIDNHLRGIMTSPGVSDQQRIVADRLITTIDSITLLLQQVRTETLHLLRTSTVPTAFQLNTLMMMESQAQKDMQQFTHTLLQLLSFPISVL